MTPGQLQEAQDTMGHLEAQKTPAREIIERLQSDFPAQLPKKWHAERVFRTEAKKVESEEIKEDAEVLGIEKFRIELSPNPCLACRIFAGGGRRVFSKGELIHEGRAAPPVHPNCRCVLIPLI